MKIKWYLSTLVILLSFLGICHNQISTPNQEILVQFNTEEVTSEQSKKAIEVIKQQLHNFGIESFHIREIENGELRISYHSSLDVESIKKALSEKELGLALSSLQQDKKTSKKPSEEHHKDYDLDVYEIQKTSDGNNSAGKFVIVVKQDYDRYLNSNFYPSFNQTDFGQLKVVENLPNNSIEYIAFVINYTSHVIPEVRAGPAFANS